MKARTFSTMAAGVIAAGFAAWACGGGGDAPPKTAAAAGGPVKGIEGEDASRCDYKGRADREVNETAGPGAIQPNIRRVFAIVGEGDERRKILLCREVDTNLDGMKDVVRTYTDKGEALNELADTDYDGQIDTWVTFSRGRIAKWQIDQNRDGRPDEARFYTAGKLARAQRDTNNDGKPDVWEIYDEGRLQRMGVDIDRDGHVDRWDRDEEVMRAMAEQERRDVEKEEAERRRAAGDALDAGGVTDARVSVRKR
jgi:hypothetical protein